MALPALDVAAVRHYCEQRVPPDALSQVRIEVDVGTNTLTIVECRVPWRADDEPQWTRSEIARLRYVAKRSHWELYWKDSHEKWHRYDLAAPAPDVLSLLDEIDHDPTGIFWG